MESVRLKTALPARLGLVVLAAVGLGIGAIILLDPADQTLKGPAMGWFCVVTSTALMIRAIAASVRPGIALRDGRVEGRTVGGGRVSWDLDVDRPYFVGKRAGCHTFDRGFTPKEREARPVSRLYLTATASEELEEALRVRGRNVQQRPPERWL